MATAGGSPARRASTSSVGALTHAPPREPRRIVTRPSDSRIRSAARRDGRETPSSSSSLPSGGRASPTATVPVTIRRRSSLATATAALGVAASVLSAVAAGVTANSLPSSPPVAADDRSPGSGGPTFDRGVGTGLGLGPAGQEIRASFGPCGCHANAEVLAGHGQLHVLHGPAVRVVERADGVDPDRPLHRPKRCRRAVASEDPGEGGGLLEEGI